MRTFAHEQPLVCLNAFVFTLHETGQAAALQRYRVAVRIRMTHVTRLVRIAVAQTVISPRVEVHLALVRNF